MTASLDLFIFNLLILGALTTANGRVWRRKSTDLYILEATDTEIIEEEPKVQSVVVK